MPESSNPPPPSFEDDPAFPMPEELTPDMLKEANEKRAALLARLLAMNDPRPILEYLETIDPEMFEYIFSLVLNLATGAYDNFFLCGEESFEPQNRKHDFKFALLELHNYKLNWIGVNMGSNNELICKDSIAAIRSLALLLIHFHGPQIIDRLRKKFLLHMCISEQTLGAKIPQKIIESLGPEEKQELAAARIIDNANRYDSDKGLARLRGAIYDIQLSAGIATGEIPRSAQLFPILEKGNLVNTLYGSHQETETVPGDNYNPLQELAATFENPGTFFDVILALRDNKIPLEPPFSVTLL